MPRPHLPRLAAGFSSRHLQAACRPTSRLNPRRETRGPAETLYGSRLGSSPSVSLRAQTSSFRRPCLWRAHTASDLVTHRAGSATSERARRPPHGAYRRASSTRAGWHRSPRGRREGSGAPVARGHHRETRPTPDWTALPSGKAPAQVPTPQSRPAGLLCMRPFPTTVAEIEASGSAAGAAAASDSSTAPRTTRTARRWSSRLCWAFMS